MAIVAVIMCVNFAACSDDDEEEANATIEGTWKYFLTILKIYT